jgi:hypothetical protein
VFEENIDLRESHSEKGKAEEGIDHLSMNQ